MSEATCGTCRRWSGNYCPTAEFLSLSGYVDEDDAACPAHDDGSFDKAVRSLVEESHKSIGLWLPDVTRGEGRGFKKAIAAVEKLLEERKR